MTQGSHHLHSSSEKKIRQGGLWPTSGSVRIRALDLVFEDLHDRSKREFIPSLRGHGTVSHALLSVLGEENANDRNVLHRQPEFSSCSAARTTCEVDRLSHQQPGSGAAHSNDKPHLAQTFCNVPSPQLHIKLLTSSITWCRVLVGQLSWNALRTVLYSLSDALDHLLP